MRLDDARQVEIHKLIRTALQPDPVIGQAYTVRGQTGTITNILPAGTIDVQMANGRCYRVTGLPFGC